MAYTVVSNIFIPLSPTGDAPAGRAGVGGLRQLREINTRVLLPNLGLRGILSSGGSLHHPGDAQAGRAGVGGLCQLHGRRRYQGVRFRGAHPAPPAQPWRQGLGTGNFAARHSCAIRVSAPLGAPGATCPAWAPGFRAGKAAAPPSQLGILCQRTAPAWAPVKPGRWCGCDQPGPFAAAGARTPAARTLAARRG